MSGKGAYPRHFIYPLNPKSEQGYTFEDERGRALPTSRESFLSLLGSEDRSEWGLATGFKKVQPGDMIWAYFALPEGVIGAVGRVRNGVGWNKNWERYSIVIDWDRDLTDRLTGDPIPYESYRQQVQAAVNEANPETLKVLRKWLKNHQVASQSKRDQEVSWRTAEVVRRMGQQEFRLSLMRAYGNRCCISGCDVKEVLEAAHIQMVSGGGKHSVRNGLLLRADLHTLFDRGLIAISDEFTVLVHSSVTSPMYREFHGRQLQPPSAKGDRPTLTAIRSHRRLMPN